MTGSKERVSIGEIRKGLSPLFNDEGLRLVLLFGSVVSGKIHKKIYKRDRDLYRREFDCRE